MSKERSSAREGAAGAARLVAHDGFARYGSHWDEATRVAIQYGRQLIAALESTANVK
jgi:hypothetical protein